MSSTARILAAAIVLAMTASVSAADVVLVEETWTLKVSHPQSTKNLPQVSTVMGPTNSAEGLYFVFALNHLSVPFYAPGGMQVQAWNGDQAVAEADAPESAMLTHPNETVRWTQRLSVAEGQVVFEIVQGTSQTWNHFGGQGHLKLSRPYPAGHLNGYRPELSLTESGVGFGANHVQSLVLESVRWHLSDGRQYEMLAPIDINSDLSN